MSEQQALHNDLAKAQAAHLHWLETYSKNQPDLLVAGVDILPMFNYELIQYLNHVYLQERLVQA